MDRLPLLYSIWIDLLVVQPLLHKRSIRRPVRFVFFDISHLRATQRTRFSNATFHFLETSRIAPDVIFTYVLSRYNILTHLVHITFPLVK